MEFGTPATEYSFLFDSGSSRTWIKDRKCNCGGKYTTSASFQLINNTISTVSYADGTKVSGPIARDNVSINGLGVKYSFTLAQSLQAANGQSVNQYQGITGFGFSSNESTPSLLSTIFQNYPALPPVISYFIDKSETKGGITLGGIDVARFSGRLAVQDIIPVSSDNLETLSLPLNSIKIGNSNIALSSLNTVLIDTGTSLTILPLEVATEINQKLNYIPLGDDFPGLFGTFCPNGTIPDGLPNIIMKLGNVELKFTPDTYTFLISDQETSYCVSGIQGSKLNYSIIGNVLLRRYYTVFDLYHKRIGFATCNRDPIANSSIISVNLSQIVTGIADPNSVFGETSSESFGHKIHSISYLLIIMILLVIL